MVRRMGAYIGNTPTAGNQAAMFRLFRLICVIRYDRHTPSLEQSSRPHPTTAKCSSGANNTKAPLPLLAAAPGRKSSTSPFIPLPLT